MTSPVSAVEAIEKAMEGVAHAPAPWEAEGTSVYCDDSTGQRVATTQGEYLFWTEKQKRANAAYIAACSPDRMREVLALARQAEALKLALKTPFCVLFLDGRNEHGSHVLPSYPRSFEVVDGDVADQAEAILEAAENTGFQIGQHVWAEFAWIAPQIGDDGRVELDGYWDFRWINESMSTLLKEEANAE